MRSLPRLVVLGFVGLAVASPVIGQRADDQIQPKSVELQREARTLMTAGKLEQADDVLETALAVDPRNRGAFVDLARVAQKQHLFGKAIRMTSKALLGASPVSEGWHSSVAIDRNTGKFAAGTDKIDGRKYSHTELKGVCILPEALQGSKFKPAAAS
jgi:hypothetical protein